VWLGKCVLVDAGIDWFTTTATDRKTATLLLLKAENYLSQEARSGCYIKPWKMAGYSGWRCGRLEYGIRDDGAIVRLSSGLAAIEWWYVFQITGRCSRIDLQVTLRHIDGPTIPISRLSRKIKRFYKGRKDGPTITEWRDSDGGHTLYLGKRQSDLYFRCYNKEAQSSDPKFMGCVRLELEIKNRVTLSVIESLMSYETIHAGILGILSYFIVDRGGPPLTVSVRPTSFYEVSVRTPDALKSLAWFNNSVKPSVSVLIEMGYLKDVIENLGLQKFVRPIVLDSDNLN